MDQVAKGSFPDDVFMHRDTDASDGGVVQSEFRLAVSPGHAFQNFATGGN